MRTVIEKRHGDAIAGFRRSFLDEANLYWEDRTYRDVRESGDIPLGIGPVRSVSDRHANITVEADLATLSYAVETPGLLGYKLTLSMAGHHRVLDTRVVLSVEETEAWAYAVLGDQWADHSYYGGLVSGPGRLGVVFYLLYLGEDFELIERPDVETFPGIVPVNVDAFQ